MSNLQSVSFDAVRTLAHASIAATYNVIGAVLAHPVRLICFTNNSDGDLFFSVDGVTDQLFVAAGSFKLFDLSTNRITQCPYWVLAEKTQIFVRYNTAPSKGDVYVECLWGE